MPKRDADLLLEDMAAAMARVLRYVDGLDRIAFLADDKTVDAVVRNLEVIGEAARMLPDDVKVAHASIPWRQITGLRNRIVHDYFGLDLEIIWEIVTVSIPEFNRRIAEIRSK